MKNVSVVKNSRGFTLIEMVVVLAVIAILAAILTPMVTSYVQSSRLSAAKNDLKNIAAAVVQFNTDTKLWPIENTAFVNLNDTPNDVELTPGNVALYGNTSVTLVTGSSTNNLLAGPLNQNAMSLPTTGSRAWKGAYLELGPDPWGTAYYLTAKHLKAGDVDAAFVMSAGPDQTIETSFDQSQSGTLTVNGDDIVVRIK
jgi:prepilin-type N-terminal cleavage/methylation domain-containing protein